MRKTNKSKTIEGATALAKAFGIGVATFYLRLKTGHPIARIVRRHPTRKALWIADRSAVEAFMRGDAS